MSGSWYAETFRKLHLDYHMNNRIENVAGDLDAERVVDMFERAHIQAVCIFSRDSFGNCPYFTKIGRRHPNLRKDYLRDMSEALKRRGMRVMVYFGPTVDQVESERHPEWRVVKADGEASGAALTGGMCLYSPYTDNVVIPQLQEIARNYPVDAFFLDGPFHQFMTTCYCGYCREGFHRHRGGEIPKKPEDRLAFEYRLWRNSCFQEFEKKVIDAVREVRPEILLCSNFAYSTRFAVPPPEYVGYVSMDPPTPSAGSYALHFSFEGRYLSTGRTPFDYMNTRFTYWGDWTIRPAVALKFECALALANGAKCFVADQPYPNGSHEPAVYGMFREVYEFVREREELCRGARPVPYIAVLHSARSHWSKTPLDPWPTWAGGPGLEPVLGAHKALVESGLHFNILNSETLLHTLPSYKALVLPDQVCLSEAEVEAIRGFVKDGGGLVASFETSLRDERNQPLRDLALSDVLGVSYGGRSPYPVGYIKPGAEVLEGSGVSDMPHLTYAPFALVEPTTAEALCPLLHPLRESLPTKEMPTWPGPGAPPPGEASGHPAVTINRHGSGRAVYISGEVFGGYWRQNTPDLKRLISKCLDMVVAEKVIEVEAPPSVEVSLFTQGRNRLVHLVNYHGEKRDVGTPSIEHIPVLRDIRVRLRSHDKPRAVVQMPEDRMLQWELRDRILSFTVPELHIHSCAVVEY